MCFVHVFCWKKNQIIVQKCSLKEVKKLVSTALGNSILYILSCLVVHPPWIQISKCIQSLCYVKNLFLPKGGWKRNSFFC